MRHARAMHAPCTPHSQARWASHTQGQKATATVLLQTRQPGVTRLVACSPDGVPDLPVVSLPEPELA